MSDDRQESDRAVNELLTPAMIEAGVMTYLEADRENDPAEQVIREIYEAMRAVALRSP